jgi:hypothetical protein
VLDDFKSDRRVPGTAQHMEQIDSEIEEQVKLKEEELKLKRKVKTAQKKLEESELRQIQKNAKPVFSKSQKPTSMANDETLSSEHRLMLLKRQLID